MNDKTVESFYDLNVEYEWERLNRHKIEFATTWRAMTEYLQPASRILDIGGGPGRYSINLARQGHRVVLLDLSAGNIALAREKAQEAQVTLEDFIHGNALDLAGFPESSFDAVLLMGPLYHLLEAADRKKALMEARRVLKPGGLIFVSFITRYAFLIDALKHNPAGIHGQEENVRSLLANGVNRVSDENPGFTNAFFIHPGDVVPLMEESGFRHLRVAASEPLVAAAEPAVNSLTDEQFQTWSDLCYRLGTDPVTWGSAEHILFVGRK